VLEELQHALCAGGGGEDLHDVRGLLRGGGGALEHRGLVAADGGGRVVGAGGQRERELRPVDAISGRCGGGNIGVVATLEVRAVPTATTTPAPAPSATAPPAPAPSATAPPATQPTASTADSWIIPGLVGLAVGVLAVLGVWLLYRHRHRTGLDGSGRSGEV
jgi:hypothetical protein